MRIPLLTFLMVTATLLVAQKQVYIPRFITNEGMDLNDPSSQWCYCRSMETENIVVFWEPGFGDDPTTAEAPYQINMDNLLQEAEKTYAVHIDELKFATEGESVTDDYKLMIFLLYSTEWAAYGSGQDNLVGTLHVNPAAANSYTTVAHEIGHCFQYITGCDTDGGYRYGLGANGAGGNGFWEQCAQWQSFKVYPDRQFGGGNFNNYINSNHLHIFHEDPRYANYFIQDYWAYKRGLDMIGRLWRESRFPEDPVETYKRLNGINQSTFNDEIYEHAARLTTWDIPVLLPYGQNRINARPQVPMTQIGEFWRVDAQKCIENYGYNSIKLNAPSEAAEVTVQFQGLAGESGYRSLNINQGGWRFGFVALLEDGSRVYSDVGRGLVQNGSNPDISLSFDCPDNCTNLWLVVSGAPQQHWKHEWDDDDSNDEHWPYQVKFTNTNLLGVFDNPIHDETLTYEVLMDPMSDYTSTTIALNVSKISHAFAMAPNDIASNLGTSVIYYGVNPDGTLNPNSTANAPGHWYGNTGETVGWGANAYIFSELNINNMEASIGQYPNRSAAGDQYTIRQALIYTESPGVTARVDIIFHITISGGYDCNGDEDGTAYYDVCGQCAGGNTGIEPITDTQECIATSTENPTTYELKVYPNPTTDQLYMDKHFSWKLFTQDGLQMEQGEGKTINLTDYASGMYLLSIEGQYIKVMKE